MIQQGSHDVVRRPETNKYTHICIYIYIYIYTYKNTHTCVCVCVNIFFQNKKNKKQSVTFKKKLFALWIYLHWALCQGYLI